MVNETVQIVNCGLQIPGKKVYSEAIKSFKEAR